MSKESRPQQKKRSLVISGKSLLKGFRQKKVLSVADKIFDASGLLDMYVLLHFVKTKQMTELNKRWRNKEGVTDVLSFSALENVDEVSGFEFVLGDVVICVKQARKQAKQNGNKLEEEIAALFAHGLMHLLGFDHEKSPEESTRQVEAEMSLLDIAGISPKVSLTKRGF